jgi:hypothetical protein
MLAFARDSTKLAYAIFDQEERGYLLDLTTSKVKRVKSYFEGSPPVRVGYGMWNWPGSRTYNGLEVQREAPLRALTRRLNPGCPFLQARSSIEDDEGGQWLYVGQLPHTKSNASELPLLTSEDVVWDEAFNTLTFCVGDGQFTFMRLQ